MKKIHIFNIFFKNLLDFQWNFLLLKPNSILDDGIVSINIVCDLERKETQISTFSKSIVFIGGYMWVKNVNWILNIIWLKFNKEIFAYEIHKFHRNHPIWKHSASLWPSHLRHIKTSINFLSAGVCHRITNPFINNPLFENRNIHSSAMLSTWLFECLLHMNYGLWIMKHDSSAQIGSCFLCFISHHVDRLNQ